MDSEQRKFYDTILNGLLDITADVEMERRLDSNLVKLNILIDRLENLIQSEKAAGRNDTAEAYSSLSTAPMKLKIRVIELLAQKKMACIICAAYIKNPGKIE